MSHASIIVALSPSDLRKTGGNIEESVKHQMEPFDENGEWFADGSRWDWWVIGGRYTGKLTKYEAWKDRDNYKKCWICEGTGSRPDANYAPGSGDWARKPTDAGHPVIGRGCNACYGTGQELKWPTEWKQEGNIAKRSDVKEEIGLTAFAFLKDREWHEQGRLGWFGGTATTECERKASDDDKEFVGHCVHRCEKTGAKIISWNEGKDHEDRWKRLYFARFIRNLPDNTTLVVVDYHV